MASCWGTMLNRCVLFSVGFIALADGAIAKPIVLRCEGHQVGGDNHKLTGQIISLDLQNNVVTSIEFFGKSPKDIINAPIAGNKRELRWIYESIGFKYVLNKAEMTMELRSIPGELLGKFECVTKDKI